MQIPSIYWLNTGFPSHGLMASTFPSLWRKGAALFPSALWVNAQHLGRINNEVPCAHIYIKKNPNIYIYMFATWFVINVTYGTASVIPTNKSYEKNCVWSICVVSAGWASWSEPWRVDSKFHQAAGEMAVEALASIWWQTLALPKCQTRGGIFYQKVYVRTKENTSLPPQKI